ncbi:MAG: radical SAM family heme chaperone HemW [Candidatus Cellulosilyticum pullistercoris]|uniref:Heme chaperone HemW n=1 Tax=Candidatus Cellulosilyticum pullistercoris TaxID=2838521 RepID=A0A9E2KED3_9FIRM|nr:radical SAM family heme chaperone HemW [Candidatus Cellulosilyticum pullistercoris]
MQIGLYFHIPFCASKCYYCDFLSLPRSKEQESYIEALIKEIEKTSKSLPLDTRIKSIFIGGGTPTVLPPFLLEQLMMAITKHFKLEPYCEWTIEANPGTLDEAKMEVFKKYPITRISLGLQSTHDALLKRIGRIHTFKEWEESIRLIRKYTKWQINTDLMFALPEQTLEEFKETLETVVTYDLEHVSVYALIIEEGTQFGEWYEKGQIQEVSEVLDREMYHMAQTFLREKGYEQYEISNWSKPGKKCEHNIVYWRCEPYLGLGLGAHSLYEGKRYYNEEDIKRYIECQGDISKIRYEEEEVTDKIAMEEYVFLGLRLLEGIDENIFEKKFGKTIWTVYSEPLQKWIRLGLLIHKDNRIYLSDYGLDVCNEIFSSFL